MLHFCFFFQAEDGIRDLVRSRGLGDVYKRQAQGYADLSDAIEAAADGAGATFVSLDEAFATNDTLSLIHI